MDSRLTYASHYSIALAFENLTPNQVCAAFSRALLRPCRYVYDPHIEVKVPIPPGYREQLAGIEVLFGKYNAPYFPGPEFQFPPPRDSRHSERRSPEMGSRERQKKLTTEARDLWGGYRGIEAYAREAFPVEEEANGKDWMVGKVFST